MKRNYVATYSDYSQRNIMFFIKYNHVNWALFCANSQVTLIGDLALFERQLGCTELHGTGAIFPSSLQAVL